MDCDALYIKYDNTVMNRLLSVLSTARYGIIICFGHIWNVMHFDFETFIHTMFSLGQILL